MSVITIELLKQIRKHYCLKWHGIHGIGHWYRVYKNGLKLSGQDGVNSKVVQLFSIFHDSQRKNEGDDHGHGRRGAKLAMKLRDYLPIDDDQFRLLTTACELHTSTLDHENITVQACFDSDRLDLGRVGIYPDHRLLCTPLAKQTETIEGAYRKSIYNNELSGGAFSFPLIGWL